jgi:hypothetical protein
MKKQINLLVLLLAFLSNVSLAQFAYRSAVTAGNWNAIASWERFNGSSWAAATTGQIPGQNDTVYIQTGHTISLTQNESCYTLNLHNATSSRLNLAGFILNVHGNLGCFNSAINIYPVTFTGSTPGTATWINTTTAGSAIRLVGNSRAATINGQWGNNPPGWNLEVALNANQTATFNTGFKANRVTVISGTLQTNAGNDIRPDNASATTGDVIINAGAKLSLSGSMRRTGTTGAQFDSLVVNGTLEIAASSGTRGIDALNVIVGNGGKISNISSVVYTGVIPNLNYNTGSTLEYAGSVAQTAGAEFGATANVKKLVINNSNGVTINGTRSITDTLQMIAGNITIPTTDSLILGVNANATLIRTNGNIIGKINRFVSGTTTGPMVFPTGSVSFYRPVVVNFVSAPMAGGNISIMHVDSGIGGTNISSFLDGSYTVNRRSNMYWTGSVNNGLTALNLTLTIDANGIAGINNASENRIIGSTDNGVTFGAPGGTHAAGSGSTATRTAFQVIPVTFRMYMGGNATTNPLPVSLSYFTGNYHDGAVLLRWATASETNNKGFAIERSEDGINFEQIGFVNGMGNSQKLNEYKFIDAQSLPVAFYQLKQIDFDGTTETSQIIKIETIKEIFEVSPNPFNGIIRVGSDHNQNTIEIVIYDLQGKAKLSMAGQGNLVVDAQNLEAGIYLMEINQGDTKQVKRIIKN